jgi:hypothetical protein
MKTERDAETDLLLDIQKIIGADNPYDAVTLVRYVESREAELRTQIADELAELRSNVVDVEFLQGRLDIFEEQIRGNK